MKTRKLTDATKENITYYDRLACVYCLSNKITGPDILEFTGGKTALAICPHCGIDSVVVQDEEYSTSALIAAHVSGFHVAGKISDDGAFGPEQSTTCGHRWCWPWDRYITDLHKEIEK